jgi:UDP-N-acetylglucosamine--N-acetylmuramyl-(pentapeptide) pyrophosphoryl-undecaprenol N-acetylglucosamine transferase
VRPQWPELTDWPRLIADAQALGSDVWERWRTADAAARAAALIERVAS